MSIAEKLITIAENEQRVFEAGQKSAVDESKIIEATATGKGSITLNDVSEIPHKIKATLKKNENVNFTAVRVNYEYEVPFNDTEPMPINKINEATYTIECWYEFGDTSVWGTSNCTITVPEDFDFSILDGALGIIVQDAYYDDDEHEFTVVYPDVTKLKLTVTDNDTNTATYTPNADGIIEGITSYSPNIKFSVNDSNAKFIVDYHKSWGMQEGANKIFSRIQDYPKTQNYYYAFAYDRFDDTNFCPVAPIKCSSGTTPGRYIFYNAEKLTDTKVEIVANNNNIDRTFQGCTRLVNVRKLTVQDTTKFDNTFASCTALAEIRIGGTIGQSISFSYSPLTIASMKSVINALKNYVGTSNEGVYTVKFTDACWKELEKDSTSPTGTTWKDYVRNELGWLI